MWQLAINDAVSAAINEDVPLELIREQVTRAAATAQRTREERHQREVELVTEDGRLTLEGAAHLLGEETITEYIDREELL